MTLRERIKKHFKHFPGKEATALLFVIAKALRDGKVSGAEWEEIAEKFEALRLAISAEPIEEEVT